MFKGETMKHTPFTDNLINYIKEDLQTFYGLAYNHTIGEYVHYRKAMQVVDKIKEEQGLTEQNVFVRLNKDDPKEARIKLVVQEIGSNHKTLVGEKVLEISQEDEAYLLSEYGIIETYKRDLDFVLESATREIKDLPADANLKGNYAIELARDITAELTADDFLSYQDYAYNLYLKDVKRGDITDEIRDDVLYIFLPTYCKTIKERGSYIELQLRDAFNMWVRSVALSLPAYIVDTLYWDAVISQDNDAYGNIYKSMQAVNAPAKELADKYYPLSKRIEAEHEADVIEFDGNATLDLFKTGEEYEILTHNYTVPKHYTQDVTKSSWVIFNRKKNAEELRQMQIDVSKRDSKKEVYVYADIDIENVETSKNLTEFDGLVLNVIYSLIADGQTVFTSKQVATLLYHGNNPKGKKVTSKQVGAVTKSIEKMWDIKLSINWEEHADYKNIPANLSHKRTGRILDLEKVEYKCGGQILKGYSLIKFPPFYEYAKEIGQINTVDLGLRYIEGLRIDEEKALIIDYMLKQIGHMEKNKNFEHTMTFNKIFDYAGIDFENISAQARSRQVGYVEQILTDWRRKGKIKKYAIKKHGKTMHGVMIYL